MTAINRLLARTRLKTRLMLALVGIVLLQAIVSGSFTLHYLEVILEERIGDQALQLSRVVSSLPQIRQGLRQRDVEQIQPLAESIREQTDARFIVVGDLDGIRFSHPIPERIGKKRVGGDNQRAIDTGESYVSRAVGSLGPSMRGKSPVFDTDGKVIGVTSVGYMLDSVDDTVKGYQQSVIVIVGGALLVSIMIGLAITGYFKRVLLGLEPEEIARLFEERVATLETVREGIISIDHDGRITTFNRNAVEALDLPRQETLTGRDIREVLPESDMWSVLENGESVKDREVLVNGKSLIVNRLPVLHDGRVTGVVSSFRPKGELELLTRQLSHIEQYAETLRSQSHEYANKLHTIAGLIQIDAKDEALELIGQESKGVQELVHLLVAAVPDAVIAGCILGKFNRARELGLELIVDGESHMSDVPESISREHIVTMLGNLLDNAFEATRLHHKKDTSVEPSIKLTMSDYGNDLIFEIDDNGEGIPDREKQRIFEKGVTSKTEAGHGYGLYLVAEIIAELEGQISFSPIETGGTRVTVYLPKSGQQSLTGESRA
ncbi:MAG: sensor histidine kinase [Gammaproteobacteria bacterium]|nr:MAG: sensor histidine kinase [Gammaproteobacteria bacterium]UCH38647.1 MAG: sensor histidine kinase [Gammaproteobacteria bacterium]